MSGGTKIDAHLDRLVNLFRGKQYNGLDAECPADIAHKRDSSCTDVIGQIYDDIEIVLPKGKVKSFQ